MDGRIQEPIIKYLKRKHNVKYIDTITEPGPCKILAFNDDKIKVKSIIDRVKISVEKHGSKLIAVSGHYDCAGNPVDEMIQIEQVKDSIKLIQSNFHHAEVIGLWINSGWRVKLIKPE
jgi:hypothetical protein